MKSTQWKSVSILSLALLAACVQNDDRVSTEVAAEPESVAEEPGTPTGSQSDSAANGAVPGTTAREAIDAAVDALGGAQRINSIRNITLLGYGHHAYHQGGSNITALVNAPQKYIAASDMRRIYDLENDRYYQQERRNNLFPFAAYRGHSFDLRREILDGDVAYVVNTDDQASSGGDPRDLRMWMHTNPVVAVRAAMDPANTLDNRREDGGLTLVDITLAEGDRLTMAIRPPLNEPAWVQWIAPHNNLGEVTLTTHFTGYVPYDGVYLPLGYNTRLDWRGVELLKMWIDGYFIDSETPDLAAPDTVRADPGGSPASDGEEISPLRRGVWRIGGTAVIEFADHLTLFEVGGGPDRVRAAVALANTIVPGKAVTNVIQSHHHFDHSAGLRQAVAEGLTIITRRNNCVIFEEMTSRPAPNFPDDLQRSRNALTCVPMDDSMILEDDAMRVELYHTINNNHTADNLFAYIPEHSMVIEADVASAALELQWWGDSWIDNVEYRGLDVALNLPIHDIGGRGLWTYDETLELIEPGIERAKEWCAEFESDGNYFAGCPAFVR